MNYSYNFLRHGYHLPTPVVPTRPTWQVDRRVTLATWRSPTGLETAWLRCSRAEQQTSQGLDGVVAVVQASYALLRSE